MPSIFDDEERNPGQIWPNRFATRRICSMDFVAKSLMWVTLPRLSRLAIDQMGRAGATTLIVHKP